MREYQKGLHMVFVDFEKAYDTVPWDLIWYCLRQKGVPERYVSNMQDMCENSRTSAITSVGTTEEMNIEVELHEGSA